MGRRDTTKARGVVRELSLSLIRDARDSFLRLES
jgi:hypothetical protein